MVEGICVRTRNLVLVIVLGLAVVIGGMMALAWPTFQKQKAAALTTAMLVDASDLHGKWAASRDPAGADDNLDQIALRCERALDLDEPRIHVAGANYVVPRAMIYSFAQGFGSGASVAKLESAFPTTFAHCMSTVFHSPVRVIATEFPGGTRTVRFGVGRRGYFDLTLMTQGKRALFVMYSGEGRPASPGPVLQVLERRAVHAR